jgi:hypothetical protein
MMICKKISIEIDCGNDAFRSGFGTVNYEAVMDILHENIFGIMFEGYEHRMLIDRNGNRCGTVDVEYGEE